MKRVLWKLAALGVLAGIGGLAFAWSGLYSVAATAGHWPVTDWFLRLAMESSVRTHALPLEAPPLDDAAMIERGAGHYETGCAPCHGAPGVPGNRIPRNMLPNPPSLVGASYSWSREQLFWIVMHGLKYTGMPAWPAQSRDDEVWAVAALLLKLPDMSPQDYAALAKGAGAGAQAPAPSAGEPPLPETPGELFNMSDAALIGACVRCHGVDGAGRPSGAFPRIDIQAPDYLYRALDEYASGVRPSGFMQPVAAALDEQQMQRVARHYSQAAGSAGRESSAADSEVLEMGRRIAEEGVAERRIAACAACHGLEEGPENALFPALAGQHAAFIVLQLRLWKEGKRGGSSYSAIMQPIVANMTSEDIEAVARYYASLGVEEGGSETPAR